MRVLHTSLSEAATVNRPRKFKAYTWNGRTATLFVELLLPREIITRGMREGFVGADSGSRHFDDVIWLGGEQAVS